MSKVSIIGAGNVGATAAQFIAMKELASTVVLVDVKDGLAEGKAMDIMQSLFILGSSTDVIGSTRNYEPTKDSDIVIITSGVPRKPGMTREELVGINSGIVKEVLSSAYSFSPGAIFVIVSNPMDTMTFLAVKYLHSLGKEDAKSTVFGMGGVLDSARFQYYMTKVLRKNMRFPEDYITKDEVSGMVVGGHGDTTMVPLPQTTDLMGEISPIDWDAIESNTKVGGKTLTNLLGTSAWMAPAAAISRVVEDILRNFTFSESPQSVYREEYDACIGTPVILSRSGILEVCPGEWEEQENFKKSLEAVKEVNKALGEL